MAPESITTVSIKSQNAALVLGFWLLSLRDVNIFNAYNDNKFKPLVS
jgi:hypothetical protein